MEINKKMKENHKPLRIPKDKTQKTKYKVGTGDQSRACTRVTGSSLSAVNDDLRTDEPTLRCRQNQGTGVCKLVTRGEFTGE